ncbi:hypothetical protein DICA1_C13608 [Diutina catenulata]
MPRPKKLKCSNCRKLRIACDRLQPCEYCVATGRKCEYIMPEEGWQGYSKVKGPTTVARLPLSEPVMAIVTYAADLNNPSQLTGIPQFELDLLDYHTSWWLSRITEEIPEIRDYRQTNNRFFFTSSLVRNGMLSYMGLQFLYREAPKLLEGVDVPANESYALALEYTTSSFDRQCLAINDMIAKLNNEGLTPREASELMFAVSHLYLTTTIHPRRPSPLVDFEHRKFDHLGMIRGLHVVGDMAKPYLDPEETGQWSWETLDHFVMTHGPLQMPFFIRVATHITNYGDFSYDWHALVAMMDTTLAQGASSRGSAQFHLLISHSGDDFHNKVYDKNPVALALLNVYAAYQVMFRVSVDPRDNIWRDYMLWYQQHSHQEWFASWEPALFELVVEKGYFFPAYGVVAGFDPDICNILEH